MKLDIRKFEILLAKQCLSAVELCRKSEISPMTLSKLRGGSLARPSTIGKIAKALNVEVIELIKDL